MPFKEFVLDEDTTITVYKRKKSRSLRLSVNAEGRIRVSIPHWTPYSAGVQFAQSKKSWIASQRRTPELLVDGQPVGKAHRLHLRAEAIERVSTRVYANDIIVRYPLNLTTDSAAVQAAAGKASVRALKQQAETLLPQRLAALAEKHGLDYGEVKIKQLKSRWGSCDQNRNITLNLYLMQMPWDHIDYVLLHELVHTRIMQHGPVFWSAMTELMPNLTQLRKTMRTQQPKLHSPQPAAMA